jgi:hypothetical protein
MSRIFTLVTFLSLLVPSLYAVNDPVLRSALLYYNKGEYKQSLSILTDHIHNSNVSISSTEKKMYLYFLIETDVNQLDSVLHRLYKEERLYPGKRFFALVYIFMDKAILVGEHTKILYWGEVFRQRGRLSNYYLKGLYLYACVLFGKKKFQTLQLVLDEALSFEKAVRHRDKFLLLNSARPNDNYSIETKHLQTAIHSNYRYLIFRNLIYYYRKKGKVEEANRLQKVLSKYNRIY